MARRVVSLAEMPGLTFDQIDVLYEMTERAQARDRADYMADLRTVLADAFSKDSTAATDRIRELFAVFAGTSKDADDGGSPYTRDTDSDVLRL